MSKSLSRGSDTITAEDCQYFYEDEVYRVTKKGNLHFGLVVENAEFVSSDDSDSDDSDSEDSEDERLKRGHIRVAWHPTGDEEVVSEKKVGLADRSLMPGDVVRRLIKDQDTQRGYCREVEVFAAVEIVGTNQVIYGCNSKNLVPLEEFAVDVAVSLDAWVGIIKQVKTKIKVRFNDGSICVLDDHAAEELQDVLDKRDSECEFKRYDFYPGQILSGPLKLFEDGEWSSCTPNLTRLRTNKPNLSMRVVVESSEVHSLGIHWQCHAFNADTSAFTDGRGEVKQPRFTITGSDLKRVKMLNVFEPCTLQIGDRNFYILKDSDVIMTKDDWKKLEKELLRQHNNLSSTKSGKKVPKKKKEEEKKPIPAAVVDLKEDNEEDENDDDNDQYEDVETSDDDDEDDESEASSKHRQCNKAGRKRNTVMTKVLQKKKKKLRKSRKFGAQLLPMVVVKPGDKVVVETLCTRSEATVVWQDGTIEHSISSRELYPIHHLDDQEFFSGDFVVRSTDISFSPRLYGVVQDVDHSGRTCSVKWFKTYQTGSEPQPLYVETTEEPVYDLRDHPDFKYRPGSVVIRVANFDDKSKTSGFGGQVMDNYPSGKVLVWWANEEINYCWPQDLYKLGEYDSDEGELWEDSESDAGSWETESEHSLHEGDEIGEDDQAESADDKANVRPKIWASIEKTRIAVGRLEEIFNDNPSMQTTHIMKELLDVYKNCRYLDRLMGTSFFHEDNFDGLVERIQDRSVERMSNAQQAAQDQVSRLFSQPESSGETGDSKTEFLAPKSAVASSSKSSFDYSSSKASSIDVQSVRDGSSPNRDSGNETFDSNNEFDCSNIKRSVSNEKASSSSPNIKGKLPMQNVCARLCSLLKAQLLKSHDEIVSRFGGQETFIKLAEEKTEQKTGGNNISEDIDEIFHNFGLTFSDLNVLLGVMFPNENSSEASKKESLSESINEAATASSPSTNDVQVLKPLSHELGVFSVIESVPPDHKFKLSLFQPNDPKSFLKFVRKEVKLLKGSLPRDIFVKSFEDRMDLYSVMIKGPKKTPYEDGLFFFDFQLSADYPKAPPLCHYLSYCSDRLNPNLYEDGKVCVSLLGTWSGKGTETWTPNSNMLQLLVSIQGLILVNEPYFNEAGFERQKGTQQGRENSRMYNEMVVLKLVQSMTRLIENPPRIFEEEIREHFREHGTRFVDRLERWRLVSTQFTPSEGNALEAQADEIPEFPLLPASKGFCISLQNSLNAFKEAIRNLN